LFSDKDDLFFSYGLIHRINSKDNMILLDIFHPSGQNLMKLNLYDLVEPNLFRDKKFSPEMILGVKNFLQSKKVEISKLLIETLVLFFNCMKDGISQENIVTNLEMKFYKSIDESKKYYTSAITDLKKADKIKAELKQKIIKKEKGTYKQNIINTYMTSLYNIQATKPSSSDNIGSYNIVETICSDTKNLNYLPFDSLFYEIKKKSIHSMEETIYLFFQILGLESQCINLKKVGRKAVAKNLKMIDCEESVSRNAKTDNMRNNDKMVLPQKEDLAMEPPKSVEEHKYKNMSQTEKTNTIFKKYVKTDYDEDYDEKKENVNKLERNLTEKDQKVSATEKKKFEICTSLESQDENNFGTLVKSQVIERKQGILPLKVAGKIDTPKFGDKKKKKKKEKEVLNNLDEEEVDSGTMILELNKSIEEAKRTHLFLPPNEYLNIIHNTSELCHRKFFEVCFDEYFSRLFLVEKDNFGVIKMDSIIVYFYYLKGLKNFLFTEENKIYYANLFFE